MPISHVGYIRLVYDTRTDLHGLRVYCDNNSYNNHLNHIVIFIVPKSFQSQIVFRADQTFDSKFVQALIFRFFLYFLTIYFLYLILELNKTHTKLQQS